jgi:hypothetical protein
VPVICSELLTLCWLIEGEFFVLVEVDCSWSNCPGSCYNSRVHVRVKMGMKAGSQSCQWWIVIYS